MQNDEMFERTVDSGANEKPQPALWAFQDLQHLFAMFGATVPSTILNGITNISSVTSFGNRYITIY